MDGYCWCKKCKNMQKIDRISIDGENTMIATLDCGHIEIFALEQR